MKARSDIPSRLKKWSYITGNPYKNSLRRTSKTHTDGREENDQGIQLRLWIGQTGPGPGQDDLNRVQRWKIWFYPGIWKGHGGAWEANQSRMKFTITFVIVQFCIIGCFTSGNECNATAASCNAQSGQQ